MKPLLFFVLSVVAVSVVAQDSAAYTQQEVIYGRKDGTALTMQVLQPGRSVNRAVINLISGKWRSAYSRPERWLPVSKIYLSKGYTVFNVVHGSQPRYAIPDAAADVKRAVQFIRYNAKLYNVSPDYIGIVGSSSGGHLALLAGLCDDEGSATARDSVSRVSGKVQAVACFNPPTDFLNWGAPGVNPVGEKAFLQQMGVLGAFTFTQYDSAKVFYVPVENPERLAAVAKTMSPVWQVTAGDAPVFIWHGDKDDVVPLQQAQSLKEKLEAAKVPVVLKIKPGAGHEWSEMLKDEEDFVGWLDTHLKVKR